MNTFSSCKKFLLAVFSIIGLTLFSGCGGGGGSNTPTAVTLNSIAISHASVSLPKGTNTSISAIGTYSDGSSSDISTQVTWSSASLAIATIGLDGKVTGVDLGSTTASASLNSITSSDANITVTAATLNSIAITGATLTKSTNANLSAIGTYSDGTTPDITTLVTWTSAEPLTATIGSHTGTVIGTEIGATTVTAALSGITSNTVNINVIAATLSSIAITPTPVSLAKGTSTNLLATGTYSDLTTADLTTQVTWLSDAPAKASVGATTGIVQANTVGSANISATLNGVDAPSISVTVSPAVLTGVALTPSSVLLAKSANTNLSATGTYSDGSTANITTLADWTSDTPATATVGLKTGIVTGVAEGSTTISATLGSVSSPTVSINVVIFSTWNPADKGPDLMLNGSKLTASEFTGYESVRATIGVSSGTAFWEISQGLGDGITGIMGPLADVGSYISSDAFGWGLLFNDGKLYGSGKNMGWTATPIANGNVIGFGLDMTAGTLRIWVNGVDKGIAFTGLSGTIYPATTVYQGSNITANFGATPFVHPQAGYNAGVFQH